MNEPLTLMISDLHLEDGRPEVTQLFFEFLEQEAHHCDALYILGDLFEFWIGDDAISNTATEVARALRKLRDHDVPCYFMHGNRDFLLGSRYAEQAGMQLLDDPHRIDLYGTPALLLHGDSLCIDDVAYQDFRKHVRDPAWQKLFLSQSVQERLQLANHARDSSKRHTQRSSESIMDVNRQAVLDTFAEEDIPLMIHGHTHRPAVHEYEVDGQAVERVVLGDWYTQGSVLRCRPQGVQLHTLPL